MIVYGQDVKVNDQLQMNIKLPTERNIRTKAKVAWISDLQAPGSGCAVGVELLDISEADRKELGKFIFTYRGPKPK